jgi:hypothetical protein
MTMIDAATGRPVIHVASITQAALLTTAESQGRQSRLHPSAPSSLPARAALMVRWT